MAPCNISADGKQKHELARTRSFDYSTMNLAGMFCLARLGEHVGVDLWDFEVGGKNALHAALGYLAPYADAEKKWPHKQIRTIKRAKLLPLLRQGLLVYKEPRYRDMIGRFPESELSRDLSQLLYPGA